MYLRIEFGDESFDLSEHCLEYLLLAEVLDQRLISDLRIVDSLEQLQDLQAETLQRISVFFQVFVLLSQSSEFDIVDFHELRRVRFGQAGSNHFVASIQSIDEGLAPIVLLHYLDIHSRCDLELAIQV